MITFWCMVTPITFHSLAAMIYNISMHALSISICPLLMRQMIYRMQEEIWQTFAKKCHVSIHGHPFKLSFIRWRGVTYLCFSLSLSLTCFYWHFIDNSRVLELLSSLTAYPILFQMFLSSLIINWTKLIEQHSCLVVIMSHSLCNCVYLSVCVCVCVCVPFVRVYLDWQYWQIKFKMRFVCQTSDLSIIYRFIALLHFNSDLILFLCTISILAHTTCPAFAILLLQYTTLSACHMYYMYIVQTGTV